MHYCEQCQLVHGDEHRFCQRCGQLLKGSRAASNRLCARCGTLTFDGQKFCTECGLPLRVARVSEEEPQAASTRPPLFYPRNSEPRRPRQPRRPGRILSIVGFVIVLMVGYYVWQNLPTRAPIARTPTVTTPQDDSRREVEKVAEKIRAAHLNKDINKWMSCYSQSYPNLGQLERQILELWKNYDIKEVSYRIANVQRQGDKQMGADLIWNIQVFDHNSHDYTLLRPSYRILMEKSGSDWQIRDSKDIDAAGGAS